MRFTPTAEEIAKTIIVNINEVLGNNVDSKRGNDCYTSHRFASELEIEIFCNRDALIEQITSVLRTVFPKWV